MGHAEQGNSNAPMEYRSETGRLNILGFWIFLGAEIALFSTLFSTYAVLHNRTAGGVLPAELFDAKLVLIMTFLLLTSSFTCGIAVHEMRRGSLKGVMIWMIITLLLGAGFVFYEITEFTHYVHEGATLSTSAFWSAFFVLLGTHGTHVSIGIFWIIGILIQTKKRGLTPQTSTKLFISSLYWHFLDVVWIFIFTGVYLIGLVNV
ncbi:MULTISPECIES: cytochrome aa3 quinol oxidase subunit III [Bacillus]|uniref:Quinol oxidase subunit 3 n=1 Tax=Bacillus glycinifermentans TaxID=1664069 RepID=A0AAJ3Z3G9_9BACI|nr:MULTISPECIES: cytochrome aa3 quinol oxidase subunit III [Bacillus]KKB73929.1 cytochrome o ubiquinol oxidase subunit III [Bacillus sp. TH008]MBU8788678.1 cytochrome aa3 quinol oxidase subunit III [Bacillus glycinifermentans]MDU0072506.1 cytochrome aa3 quinol oxidase subunit III [Bacillus sp. IG6]MED8020294.1 cytochrome aa3 quinol oxidase subunit III [Bacillus glycinifermentans]NUJ17521.1 cytochrome aa3 quinol oxidase subunit III [Bacillus glycinifermentans]